MSSIVQFFSLKMNANACVVLLLLSLQAMLDVVANEGWLVSALSVCNLVQMIVQARWLHDSSLLTLPHIEKQDLYVFRYTYF